MLLCVCAVESTEATCMARLTRRRHHLARQWAWDRTGHAQL